MARTQAVIEELELPKDAEKPGESTDTQDSRTPKLSSVGFFEELSRFSNVEWEQHIVYVYRLAPITDRTAGGTTKYVQKYGSRFDQETLKADLGSGRYRLQMNRYGDKGQSKTVRTFEIDIEDINFPPKVPPGEWLDDPRNKRWAWARKKEEQVAAGGDPWTPERITRMVKELRPDVTQPQDQISITKAVLDAVKETRQELGVANNPTNMITTLKELILIAKPAEVSKPEGESQTFTLLMRMLDAAEKRAAQALEDAKEDRKRAEEDRKRSHDIEMAERKHAHELELERLKQRAEAASPISMVKEVLQLQKEIGQLGSDEPKNWKEKLVDQGLEYVPQILDLAGKAITSYQRAPAAPRPNQQQQQPAQPPQQAPPVTPATAGVEPMPPPPQDPDIAMLLPILELQGKRLVEAFKADPLCGADCAIAIASPLLAGKAGYERMARMGREKILATIELIPQMKADLLAIGTQEMINDFIDDIIAGPEDPDEDDEDEDGPEPGFADPIEDKQRPKHKKKVTV